MTERSRVFCAVCTRLCEAPRTGVISCARADDVFRGDRMDCDRHRALRQRSTHPLRKNLPRPRTSFGLVSDPKGDKEILMYRFICIGYRVGERYWICSTDDTVGTLIKAVRNLQREAHLLMGFVRFTIYDGVMVSCISPQNSVLPLLSDHFSRPISGRVVPDLRQDPPNGGGSQAGRNTAHVDAEIALPPIEDSEKAYRTLWVLLSDDRHRGQRESKCG